jgi:membrane-bound inhibitor of C-type lysozyme
MKKILYFAIVITTLFLGIYLYYKKPISGNIPAVNQASDGVINSVVFNCIENKNIRAIFFKDRVELSLSDGRNMLLYQAVSASGARYANPDESFVFWNKGDTAFVDEGKTTTFKDCVIAPVSVN